MRSCRQVGREVVQAVCTGSVGGFLSSEGPPGPPHTCDGSRIRSPLCQGNRVNDACGKENPHRWSIFDKEHAIRYCEERSDEAIQGEYIMNKLWIASPASNDAGSQ